ncbi:AarF/ABC1/UbiB kinase family protein [Neobacillus sp. BF23-41]|uniref:AarF/ABC1/UbiB kinase family protein n=1 Tax=Neobacillus sp. BF23-41 TaxID=3240280 RepID=UPI0034E3E62A
MLPLLKHPFRDFPGVTTPKVYWDLSTSKVLIMEFIDGVKINEIDKLDGALINKKKLASILYLSYLKQLLEDGFFHADPHPGNLLVKKDGTLCYIDFGMVGNISTNMKDNMVKLAQVKKEEDHTRISESRKIKRIVSNKGLTLSV